MASEGNGNLLNGQTLLDGFGFLEGQLIGNAPLVFPGEQDLFMVLELAAEFGGAFGPIGAIVAFIAEIIIMVLELVDFLVGLFEGVPRAQKSIVVAHRFGTGYNLVSHLIASQLYQLINDENIVLSSSLPADQAKLGALRHQGEVMLTALGSTAAQAKNAIDEVWNNTSSGTEQLPKILDQPMPAGWTLVGPQRIQTDYIKQYNLGVQQGLSPKAAAKKATKWIFQHEPQHQLVQMHLRPLPGYNPCQPGLVFNPQTGLCEPGNPIIHVCPPNQHWDDTQQMCVPDVTTPPQCPPGQVWDPITQMCVASSTSPQPCQPANDGTGDTLTDGLGCVSQNLLVIQNQIAQLQQSIMGTGGEQGDPVTCTQLSGLVSAVNVSLQAITAAIAAASSGGTPVDLTTVVTQLEAIAEAISGSTAAGGKPINVNLTSSTPLATATAEAPPTDVSAIVEQLKIANFQGDVPQETLDALAQQGFINGADLQVLQGAPWSKVLSYITGSKAYRTAEKIARAAGAEIDTVAGELEAKLAPAGNWAEQKIIGALKTERNAIQDIIAPILVAIVSSLKPVGATQIGVIGVNPDTVLADVAAVGFNLEVISTLVGLLSHGAAEGLEKITEVVTGLLGYEELREVQIGPLVANGIAKIAEMQARAIFKQELPGTGELGDYVAMGLLDPARRDAIAQFNGTPDELAPIIARARFRGLNPRQMLRLIETNLFSSAEIADELTYSAMRPVSQHRMLLAAPYLATSSERSSLRAAIENAATAGLLSDSDVSAQLDAAESNTDLHSLVLAKVHLQQLVANAKALEAEYSNLYKAGLMTDATLRASLAAIGLQQWKIDQVAATAEVAANVTLQKKTLAAEAALERATENKARAVAVKAFTDGTIDAAALLAALLATGLTAVQAAFWVTQATLQKAGALRWLYGLQLSPSEAILLRERVGALSDQRKRLQISDAQFVSALQALGIHDRFINALRAAADAMITPKTSAVVIPVQTN